MTVGELLEKLQGINSETEIRIFSREDIYEYDCERITDYEILDTIEGSKFCIRVKKGRSRIDE